jgi:hypothetical protein
MPVSAPTEVRFFSDKLNEYLGFIGPNDVTSAEHALIENILKAYIIHHGMRGNLYENQHDHKAALNALRNAITGNHNSPMLMHTFEIILKRIETEINHALATVAIHDWTESEEPAPPAPPKKKGGPIQWYKGLWLANQRVSAPPPPKLSPWQNYHNSLASPAAQTPKTDRMEIHCAA